MNDTMQQNPESQPQPQVPVPTRESVSERQVETVLGIITHLQPYLLWSHREVEQGHESLCIDGGVKCSAQHTFIKACDRLDAILADNTRWHMGSADELYRSIIDNQRSMQKFNEAQTLAVNELRRPSRIFHPSFAKTGEIFTAYHVSSDFPGGILMGTGRTPAEACLDFDKAFHRLASEQVQFNEASLEKIRASQQKVQQVQQAKAVGKRVSKVQKRTPKAGPRSNS